MSLRFYRVLLLTLGLWWLVDPFSPAWAHSELLTADPAPGARLTNSPKQIHLAFTSPLRVYSTLTVYGKQFQTVPEITPVIAAGSPQHMSATMPSLSPGVYTVQWRAISTDWDVVTGSYQFVVVGQPGYTNYMIGILIAIVTLITMVLLVNLAKGRGWKGFHSLRNE